MPDAEHQRRTRLGEASDAMDDGKREDALKILRELGLPTHDPNATIAKEMEGLVGKKRGDPAPNDHFQDVSARNLGQITPSGRLAKGPELLLDGQKSGPLVDAVRAKLMELGGLQGVEPDWRVLLNQPVEARALTMGAGGRRQLGFRKSALAVGIHQDDPYIVIVDVVKSLQGTRGKSVLIDGVLDNNCVISIAVSHTPSGRQLGKFERPNHFFVPLSGATSEPGTLQCDPDVVAAAIAQEYQKANKPFPPPQIFSRVEKANANSPARLRGGTPVPLSLLPGDECFKTALAGLELGRDAAILAAAHLPELIEEASRGGKWQSFETTGRSVSDTAAGYYGKSRS